MFSRGTLAAVPGFSIDFESASMGEALLEALAESLGRSIEINLFFLLNSSSKSWSSNLTLSKARILSLRSSLSRLLCSYSLKMIMEN